MSINRDTIEEIAVFVLYMATAAVTTFTIATAFSNLQKDLEWKEYATVNHCIKVDETDHAFAVASTGVMVYTQGKEMWRCSGNNTIHYRDK